MSFEEVRFPTDIRYTSTGGPTYNTEVVVLQSGHEQRNGNWSNPRHVYNINRLDNAGDIQVLLDFFHAMQGRLHGFRFKDWADFTSNDQQGAITNTDQVVDGVVDGVNRVFQIAKNYTKGNQTLARHITKLVTVSGIAIDTVTVLPSNYTLDMNTGVLTFDPGQAPSIGEVVTAGFEFDVPVRFDVDQLELEHHAYETITVGLPIIEIRV